MELERLAKRVRFSKPVASAIAALFVAGCYGGGESPAVSSVAAEGLTSSTTILAAAFNGTRWASIGGLQPDIVNLPGGEYQVDPVNDDGDFKAFLDPTVGNPAPSLHIYGEGASSGSVAISLASHGSYTKPQEFTVQVQLTGSAVMLVGFYSTPPAAGEDTLTGFTGLAFDTKGGSLTLVESGVNKTTLAFKGTYAFHAFNTLAYTVDTLTGSISDVTLTGSTSNYDFDSTAFTDVATEYLGLGMESGAPADACSYFDNLLVES